MSDELISLPITVGILAALALWVPALDLIECLIRKSDRRTTTTSSSAGLSEKRRRTPAI